MKEIKLKPIGFVKNNVKEARFGNSEDEISEIIVDKKYTDSFIGIEDYSHLIIIYWMDKIKKSVIYHKAAGQP